MKILFRQVRWALARIVLRVLWFFAGHLVMALGLRLATGWRVNCKNAHGVAVVGGAKGPRAVFIEKQ